MNSGNFLLGTDITWEGFNKYIQPALEKNKCVVMDKILVKDKVYQGLNNTMLASITGEGFLDKIVNYALIEAHDILEEEDKVRREQVNFHANRIAYAHQMAGFSHHEKDKDDKDIPVYIGKMKTIGLYDNEKTASSLFPTIAQSYLLDSLSEKVDDVEEKIKSLLDTKLSDL